MKEAVLKYLKSDRSFGAGLNLYQSMPGANRAIVAALSRNGSTQNNLAQLHYDLAKLAGITEREMQVVLAQPKTEAKAPTAEAASENTESASWQDLSYQEQKALVKALSLPVENQKGDTLKAALEAHYVQKKS